MMCADSTIMVTKRAARGAELPRQKKARRKGGKKAAAEAAAEVVVAVYRPALKELEKH